MRILLAEDELITRRIAEATMRSAGHDVLAVGDGDAAVAAFTADPRPLLVIDWQMPGLDGIEACRRIRATEPGRHAFIILFTGRDRPEDLAAAIDAGADDYLIKPVTAPHMLARLHIAERRIESDAARRAAERALEEARWQAGVAETVLAMQHELNNPLAALLAILELADDERSTPAELRTAIGQSLQQTRRIVDIMRRIGNLRRRRSVEYIPGVKMLDVSASE